jgi:hypothetical protein
MTRFLTMFYGREKPSYYLCILISFWRHRKLRQVSVSGHLIFICMPWVREAKLQLNHLNFIWRHRKLRQVSESGPTDPSTDGRDSIPIRGTVISAFFIVPLIVFMLIIATLNLSNEVIIYICDPGSKLGQAKFLQWLMAWWRPMHSVHRCLKPFLKQPKFIYRMPNELWLWNQSEKCQKMVQNAKL